MHTHPWGAALVLVAWIFWSEFNHSIWTMEEAFETKQECEAAKALAVKLWKSWVKAGTREDLFQYSCWPDTVDPRKK